ncbi:FUN14 domain-containing protein 2 [Carettochelys insculpta]|uniref:FUN14 domain-containing protein 2 n=1 Tax=Carettochelys insculpta TaxID=44489 RepID=UPI003EBF34AD
MGEEEEEELQSRALLRSCASLVRPQQEAKRRRWARQRARGMAAAAAKKEDAREVLDLAEYTKNQPWWRKLFGPSSGSSAEKYNVTTQLVIGGVTGWCTGFIFQKVGKLAATAVGGGFFLLQIANHTGYIKVDWKLVEQDVKKAKEQLKFHSSGSKVTPEVKSRVDEVITFLKKNIILTGGFAGGFLLGMSS